MSFLSRLFGRNNYSANYYVACKALKDVFYQGRVSPENFYDDLEMAKNLVTTALIMTKKSGIRVPKSYTNLPVTFISNEDHSKFGYVVAFDDAKCECECNFVGMMVVNGEMRYYTSEYYAFNNTFGLCMFGSNGAHHFGIGDSHPRNYEEFKKALLG